MTTIATDGKTIAADSRVTGTFIGRHEKLFEIGDSGTNGTGSFPAARASRSRRSRQRANRAAMTYRRRG
jgi:hypothetical protein